MKSDNNLFLFIVLTLDSFLDSKQQSFGITMVVFVSEEISPREMTFYLASWTSEVTWQKLLQWISCVFVVRC